MRIHRAPDASLPRPAARPGRLLGLRGAVGARTTRGPRPGHAPALLGLAVGLALGGVLWWAVGAVQPSRIDAGSGTDAAGVPTAERAASPEQLETAPPQQPETAPPQRQAQEAAAPLPAAPPKPRAPVATAPRPPPAAAAPAVPPPVAAVSAAGPWVQLAALESRAEADATWQALRERHAALLGSFEPRVLRFLRDGEEYFRLRVGPFPSRGEAKALCGALRDGGASCFVASGG